MRAPTMVSEKNGPKPAQRSRDFEKSAPPKFSRGLALPRRQRDRRYIRAVLKQVAEDDDLKIVETLAE